MKTKIQNKEPGFEESLERLEALVQEMESGNFPLEDILRKYEEGNRLIKLCAAKLNAAEQRIEVLMKKKDGSLEFKPFEMEEEENEGTKEEEEKISSVRHSKSAEKKDLF